MSARRATDARMSPFQAPGSKPRHDSIQEMQVWLASATEQARRWLKRHEIDQAGNHPQHFLRLTSRVRRAATLAPQKEKPMGVATRQMTEQLIRDGKVPPLDTLDPTARPDKPVVEDTDTPQETPADDND